LDETSISSDKSIAFRGLFRIQKDFFGVRNLFLYGKSIHIIQNNSTKHKINKYNDFLIKGNKKPCAQLIENRSVTVVEVCNLSSEYFFNKYLTNTAGLSKKYKKHYNSASQSFFPIPTYQTPFLIPPLSGVVKNSQ